MQFTDIQLVAMAAILHRSFLKHATKSVFDQTPWDKLEESQQRFGLAFALEVLQRMSEEPVLKDLRPAR